MRRPSPQLSDQPAARRACLQGRPQSLLVLRRTRAGGRNTARCAAYNEHSRWSHIWRAAASAPSVLSRCTSPDLVSRMSSASCQPLLPTLLQDELQSDALDAALEETKAQVEKCITVDGRLDKAECRTAHYARRATGRHTRRHLARCTRWLDDDRIVLVMLHAMRSARSRERRSQPAAAGASFRLIARPTIVQLRHAHLPPRALSLLVLRRARTGD